MSVRIKSYNLSGITICNTRIYTIRRKGTNFLSVCKIFRKVFCHKQLKWVKTRVFVLRNQGIKESRSLKHQVKKSSIPKFLRQNLFYKEKEDVPFHLDTSSFVISLSPCEDKG